MKFLRTITNSLLSKDFYVDILRNEHPKQVRKGIWFLFRLYVVVALFLTVMISINISAVIPRLDAVARDLLPTGAEIVIRDDGLTTNTNPIIIAMPADVNVKNQPATSTDAVAAKPAKVENLLVLDITASTTVDDLEERNTIALVTADGFIFQGENGRYSIGKFSNLKDLNVTIDEEWLVAKVAWMKGFMKFIPFVAFFFVLVGLFASSLFVCLIYALIILLIMKIQKKDHPFATAYTIALYSRTFAIVLGLLAYLMPFFGSNTVSVALQLIFISFMLYSKKAIIDAEDDGHEIKA